MPVYLQRHKVMGSIWRVSGVWVARKYMLERLEGKTLQHQGMAWGRELERSQQKITSI